jgi:two-component system chemotaxis sensor kinase CheA
MAEQAVALGSRLNKPLDVQIESNRVRLCEEGFGEFWSAAVHVVRNAVDHGIESTEERQTLGKSVPASVTLRTSVTPESLTIEFSDSGRGIDWPAVARQARSLGLAAETHEDLIEALFADGVTTRAVVSELSGRGMGLGAVRHACQKLGGTVEVASVAGVGTTFRFVWPATVVASTSTPALTRWERAS